ncbi:MAG: nucleotidyltransferase [Pyrinomonadaceae bacterium]
MKLNWYFDELKSAIEPDPQYMINAQKADDPVREHLRDHESFSRRYLDSFLYGSYARNTSVGNIKDVDIVIVCDFSRYSSPLTLLTELRDSLCHLYDDVDLGDQRRSIRVDRPLPDVPDSELTLDVIPAIREDGSDGKLWVPDRDKREWTVSHPRGHMNYTTALNAASHQSRSFVPLAKMLKWWWKHQSEVKRPWVESFRRKPKGFWIETMAGQFVDLSKESYPDLIISVLENAHAEFAKFRSTRRIPELKDPALEGKTIKTSITEDEFDFFLDTLEESLEMAREAASSTSEERAVDIWNSLFGQGTEMSKSLKGEGDLLRPAVAPPSTPFTFPSAPIAPKKPVGFG